jgi:lipid II:glycine glycyltransferase (peptidoglycan interpeptide bridge formation enzyme)
MKIAKSKGCYEYDMFGVAPRPDPSHPLYGLYRFKTGFGGNLYHRMGSWDYPLSEDKYNFFRSVELNNQGFHNN